MVNQPYETWTHPSWRVNLEPDIFELSHHLNERSQSDMSDLNRGIMKFKGADSPTAIAVSAVLVLGGIGFLIWWALHAAYTVG